MLLCQSDAPVVGGATAAEVDAAVMMTAMLLLDWVTRSQRVLLALCYECSYAFPLSMVSDHLTIEQLSSKLLAARREKGGGWAMRMVRLMMFIKHQSVDRRRGPENKCDRPHTAIAYRSSESTSVNSILQCILTVSFMRDEE